MAKLEEKRDILKQKIEALDQLWELLDQAWNKAPSEITDRIYAKADKFYTAYSDVFRKALETEDIEQFRTLAQEFYENAGDEVAGAWEIVASHSVEQNEKSLEEAEKYPNILVRDMRELEHQSKQYLYEAEQKRGNNKYLDAIEEYKKCREESLKCSFAIEDAIRVQRREEKREKKEEKREEKRLVLTKRQAILGIAAVILGPTLAYVIAPFLLDLLRRLMQGSTP
ncbi:MAG: hypothetical protein RX318_10380 [bacterium]|nr:hypothetical protein [bacterium]